MAWTDRSVGARLALSSCFMTALVVVMSSNAGVEGDSSGSRRSGPDLLVRPAVMQAPPTNIVRVSHDVVPSARTAQPETQTEPCLAVNPGNEDNLVAGYQDNRFEDGGALALTYATTFDGGSTWDEAPVPGLTTSSGGPWDRASDPWVAFGPGNRVYYASLLFNETNASNALGISVSPDGGRSWGSPVEVVRSKRKFNDKEAVVVDTFPGSPHFGSVYVAWDIGPGGERDEGEEGFGLTARATREPNYQLVMAHSTDGGATFSRHVVIRSKQVNIGVIPRIGPDGSVYAVWSGDTANGRHWIFFSKSTDGGVTWSKPRRISDIRLRGVAQVRSGVGLTSFDVDPVSGVLYVAWADARWARADQATMIVSHDGGQTWTQPSRVSDAPDDSPCFTVSVATSGNGNVAVTYYDLQNDPQRRTITDVYVRTSHDGGSTFDPGRRVTPESFDLAFAAHAGGYFLGDYAGLVGSNERYHLLCVATLAPSKLDASRRQPDVFAAAIPSQSAAPGT